MATARTIFGPSTEWVNSESPVLLTFEGGPSLPSTASILDTLAKYRIRAVFFVVGKQLQRPEHRSLVDRAISEGHIVGNYSYSGATLADKSRKQVEAEILKTQRALEGLGLSHRIFRPPFGGMNEHVIALTRQLGYSGLAWNIDSMDADRNNDWVAHAIEKAQPSRQGIVNLHDGLASTAASLDAFIAKLLDGGHSFPRFFSQDPAESADGLLLWHPAFPGWETLPDLPIFRPTKGEVEAKPQKRKPSWLPNISKETWDAEYEDGSWSLLGRTSEVPRYALIAGYVTHFRILGRILDVGCGEGLLVDYLKPGSYERYVGIDISQAAIGKTVSKTDEKTQFICTNAEEFTPDGSFDMIVLNECLYYFTDPLEILSRYRSFLKENGILILSMFVTDPAVSKLAKALDRLHDCVDRVLISNSRGKWMFSTYGPADRIASSSQTSQSS